MIATVLTEYGAEVGAHWHLLAESAADRADVGVSYVMYAVLAASLMSLTGSVKLVGVGIVSVCVLVSFLLAPGMTTTGHVLSVAIGAAMMVLPRRSAHDRVTSECRTGAEL